MALSGASGDTEAVLKIRIDGKQAETDMQLFSRSATAAFDKILEANQRLVAAIERGGRAGDIFASLSIGIEQAQRASGGLVSQTNLAIAANRAQQAGLNLTERQFAALTAAARRFADATGGDTTQAMDQLTRAIVSGSSRALKQFGIDLGSSQDRIVKAEEALGKLERRFGDAEIAADDAADQILRIKNALSDVTDQMDRGLAENGALTRGLGVFADMAEQVSRLSAATDGWGQALRGLAGGLGAALGGITPLITAMGALEDVGSRLDLLTGQTGQAALAFDETTGDAGRPGRQAPRFSQAPTAGRTPGRVGVNTRPNSGRRGSGGGGGGKGESDPVSAALRAQVEAQIAWEHDTAVQETQWRTDRDAAENERVARNAQEKAEILQQARQTELDREQSLASAMSQVRAQKQNEDKQRDAEAIQMQRDLVGVTAGILKQGAKLMGASKGEMLVIDGIYETVQAAIAWANAANPFGGQAWIPTAVMHTAAAAMAFAEAAGLGASGGGRGAARGGGGGGGSRSSADFAPNRGAGASMSSDQPLNITVVMGPGGVVMGMDDDSLRRLGGVVREASRRGYN